LGSNGLRHRPEPGNGFALCERSKAVLSPAQKVVERAHRVLGLRMLSVDDLEVRQILDRYDLKCATHLEAYEYGALDGVGLWLDEQLSRLVADRRSRVVKFRDERSFRTAAARTRWIVQKPDGTFDERLVVRALEFVLNDPTRIDGIDDDTVRSCSPYATSAASVGGRSRFGARRAVVTSNSVAWRLRGRRSETRWFYRR
jgi:hypothetical protein